MVEVNDEQILFNGDQSGFSIAIPDIKETEIVNEKNYQFYKIFYIGYPLFLSIGFIRYILSPGGNFLDLVIIAFSLPIIFYIIIYLPLAKRKWLCIKHNQNGPLINSYFSFDWRLTRLRFPWNRQEDIWAWLINRGDCKIMQALLKEKIKNYQKSECDPLCEELNSTRAV